LCPKCAGLIQSLANFLLVLYSKNSSNAFRRLWRRGANSANRGSAAPIKTAKEPVKNIGSNHILGKENFLIIKSKINLNNTYMNKKGFANIILIIIIIVFAGAVGYLVFNNQRAPESVPTPKSQTPVLTSTPDGDLLTVPLGQQFTLKKNQFVKIANTGLEIGIIEFYNSPCPKGVQCFWSGVGIGFEYRFNGEVQNGIDLVQAFGYQTTIVKTDHETYANLVVKKTK